MAGLPEHFVVFGRKTPRTPESGRQLFNFVGRVNTDALQYIHQVRIRINIVQLAGTDQTLDYAHMFGPQFSPTEHPNVFKLLSAAAMNTTVTARPTT